ncbi:type 4 pilus major pilin [Rhodanobacter sp. FW106-PBR-R2A-1-13]|uniref:type 4 pilus major pilin n=1 Tax=Rhodanobacter sp. FW106-PBR-R2A-1-13 TaxID=3454845 RepID=UPI0034E5CBBF
MNHTTFLGRRRQGGFNLVELAIVIAIIAVLIIIVMRQAGSTSSANKASNEVSAISTIIQNGKKFKSGGTYGANTDLVPILINANQVPGAINNTGGTLSNQWGNQITIKGNGPTLVVTDNQIAADACQEVVTGVAGGDPAMTVVVGGTTVTYTNGVITTQTAAAACATGPQTVTFNVPD